MTDTAATDLELQLRVGAPVGRELRVEVLDSPAGEASETATFPYDSLELDNRLKDLQIALLGRSALTRRVVPEHEQAVQRFGRELFDAMFTGEVRSLLDRSREQAISAGVALRLQLRFESADMASLPWEFLYDERRDDYLALSRTTPIVRHVELAEPQRPLKVARPLRVLAMVASPSDLPALDVTQERARIDSALGDLAGVELHWLEGGTWRDLQSALQREQFHIFHFIGHGGFDRERGEGVVALCDDRGAAHRLGASDLGLLLGDHDSLRLTVLNSCDGARRQTRHLLQHSGGARPEGNTGGHRHAVRDQRHGGRRAQPFVLRGARPRTRGRLRAHRSPQGRRTLAAGHGGVGDARLASAGPRRPHLRCPTGSARQGRRDTLAARATDTGGTAHAERTRAPRWKKPAIIAASVLVALTVIGLLLPDDKESDGGSSTATTVDSTATTDAIVLDVQPNSLASYPLDLPPNTVALVTANPGEGLDVDMAAVTDDATAASIASATNATFTDSFDAYADFASVPPGLVVGRVDEQELGAERLAVLAPEGGSFGIVVAGAAESSGLVSLDIELVEVAGTAAESTYIDRVLSDPRVAETLTAKALGELATAGTIYLPWTDEE